MALTDIVQASHDIKSLIKGLLKLDAKKRLCSKHGANDVKKHPFFEGEHWGRTFTFFCYVCWVVS